MTRILVILLAVLIVAASLYQADASAKAYFRMRAEEQLGSRADLAAATIDQLLQLRMMQTFTFAALPSMRGFASSDEIARSARAPVAQTELQAIVAADQAVRAASIVDEFGLVVLTTDSSMNADWSPRIFVQEALAGHLYGSVPARDNGEISQFYSAPILNNAREVAGALVLRIAVQEMWNAIQSPNVLVVDKNGMRIADTSAKPLTMLTLAPLNPQDEAALLNAKQYGAEMSEIRSTNLASLADQVLRKTPGIIEFRDLNGQTSIAAVSSLKTNEWKVIAFQSEDKAVEPARDVVWMETQLALVAFVAGMGGLNLVLWSDRKKETS